MSGETLAERAAALADHWDTWPKGSLAYIYADHIRALLAPVTAEPETCHCGEQVTYGYDGDPTHHRGMCERCDPVRCDTDPANCRPAAPDEGLDAAQRVEWAARGYYEGFVAGWSAGHSQETLNAALKAFPFQGVIEDSAPC